MLIIAMPKSASSSLVSTLCSLHNMEDLTGQTRDKYLSKMPVAEEYSVFAKHHSEIRQITDDSVLDDFKSLRHFNKHHIPPTENNQKKLHDIKKVILFRDPEGIVAAYKRGEDTRAFPMKSVDFAFCFSEKAG